MIVILDYGLCNIRSVEKVFEKINYPYITSNKPEDLEKASHIVLPGVGSFRDGMKNLKELGLIEPLKTQILKNKKLILGICLGMQLLADKGEENGFFEGLGIISGTVKKLQTKRDVKLPHMGWNNIKFRNSPLFNVRETKGFSEHVKVPGTLSTIENKKYFRGPKVQKSTQGLFDNIEQNTAFYFLHSYHLVPIDESIVSSTCIYGGEFVSSIQKENIFGVQFHPEKSQKNGLQLIKNFVEKC